MLLDLDFPPPDWRWPQLDDYEFDWFPAEGDEDDEEPPLDHWALLESVLYEYTEYTEYVYDEYAAAMRRLYEDSFALQMGAHKDLTEQLERELWERDDHMYDYTAALRSIYVDSYELLKCCWRRRAYVELYDALSVDTDICEALAREYYMDVLYLGEEYTSTVIRMYEDSYELLTGWRVDAYLDEDLPPSGWIMDDLIEAEFSLEMLDNGFGYASSVQRMYEDSYELLRGAFVDSCMVLDSTCNDVERRLAAPPLRQGPVPDPMETSMEAFALPALQNPFSPSPPPPPPPREGP